MILKPINATLPSSTGGSAVIAGPTLNGVNDYAIQAQGAVDIHISDVEAMTTIYTIKSGTAISLSQILSKGADLFWARSGSTASVIEILPIVK